MKKIKFKPYIAPWVLPNEDIPVHLIWDNDFEFDYLIVYLPEDIELLEILNVEEYEIKEGLIIISKRNIKRVHFPNFFGLLLKYNSIEIENLKLFRDIRISFYKSEEIKFETTLIAKIFRPKIIDKSKIRPIILDDSTTSVNISLNLQCVGFGFVDLKLKAIINRVQISIEKNLIEKVKENLEKKYKIAEDEEESNVSEKAKGKRVYVNKESINNFFEVLDKYDKLAKKTLAEQEKFEKKITDFLAENDVESRFIIDLFIELLTLIKVRNKFENVLMRDSYLEIPHEYFNEYVENIMICVSYRDLMDNEYNDVEIPLPIKDLRLKPRNTTIFFKVDIENIENDIFQNIDKIKRD